MINSKSSSLYFRSSNVYLSLIIILFFSFILHACQQSGITGSLEMSSDNALNKSKYSQINIVGVKHNEALKQVFKKLQKEKRQKGKVQLQKNKTNNYFFSTRIYKKLDNVQDAHKRSAKFKEIVYNKLEYVKGRSSSAKGKNDRITIKDLHRVKVLSDEQMNYIDQIIGMQNEDKIRSVAEQASRKLGKAGNIVCFYATTYLHSLKYWKKNYFKWKKTLGQEAHIKISTPTVNASYGLSLDELIDETGADEDVLGVVMSDAAGSVIGAASGLITFAGSGGAQYATVFGPQGLIVGATGAAITGGVIDGVLGSMTAAGIDYTLDGEWF